MKRIIAVKHDGTGKPFLFEVPEGAELHKDDMVLCETRYGQSNGSCYTDVLTVDDDAFDLIVELANAHTPLRSVIGKYEIIKTFYKTKEK